MLRVTLDFSGAIAAGVAGVFSLMNHILIRREIAHRELRRKFRQYGGRDPG